MNGWMRQKYVIFSPGLNPSLPVTGSVHWMRWLVAPTYGAP